MSVDDRTLVEGLLASGVDDWVNVGDLMTAALRAGCQTDEARISLMIGLASEVILRRWMVPGDVDEGFAPWGSPLDEAIVRIADEVRALGWSGLWPGAVVWLSNTEEGDRIGKAVLDREGTPDP